MQNRIRAMQQFRTGTSAYCVDNYIHWLQRGAMFFDADYQREYVWGGSEQQAFLKAVVSGFPLGNVAIAKTADWCEKEGPFLEVVDGKQRLTTLKLFITNVIPFVIDGIPVYWSELSRPEQLAFGKTSLPAVILNNASRDDMLNYFIVVNFTGVPQSEEHKLHVLKLVEGNADAE
ncbi:TPA: DUF262 domain-containing protein [Yersinia enterocolitica]|nr:DUF262 domain-containing protein [Yersinia enterocolitica]